MTKIKARVKNFIEGRAFAPFVALTAFISHALGIEIFAAAVILTLASLCLILSDDATPMLSPILFFTYILSTKHSPSYPEESDYLFSAHILIPLSLFGLASLFALGYFFFKNRCYAKIGTKAAEFSGLSVYILGLILSAVISLNIKNVGFATLSAVALLIPFLLFYFGVPNEKRNNFRQAVIYNALISVFLVFAELLLLYITGDVTEGGKIIKEKVALGWGIWNNIGGALVMPIPLLLLGADEARRPAPYLLGAFLAYVGAFMTLSRNSILFGTSALVISLVLLMLLGKRKKLFRIISFSALFVCAVIAFVLRSKIASVLADLFERGFSDNGRFALWREAWNGFSENAFLGNGFYAFSGEYHQFAKLFPRLPHNTPLALLFGGGIFLLLCYGYYRITTLHGFIKRPTLSNFLLLFAAMLLPLMSLLDNFFFNISPTFLYTAALAAICEEAKEQQMNKPPLTLNKIWKHTLLVTKHRWRVFLYCAKCGIFMRGLLHDLSKFSPTEFFESARWYQGNRSPIGVCRRETGVSAAWLHHKGRNKHHLEYWLDGDCKVQPPMPYEYAVECVCDKLAATRIYNGKSYTPDMLLSHWYKYGNRVEANPNTMLFIERTFLEIAELGEDAVLNAKHLKELYDKAMAEELTTAHSTNI